MNCSGNNPGFADGYKVLLNVRALTTTLPLADVRADCGRSNRYAFCLPVKYRGLLDGSIFSGSEFVETDRVISQV